MKITDNRTGKLQFGVLVSGDTFLLHEHVCMKVSEASGETWNAYDFEGNSLFRVEVGTEVEPVKAEVVIKD